MEMYLEQRLGQKPTPSDTWLVARQNVIRVLEENTQENYSERTYVRFLDCATTETYTRWKKKSDALVYEHRHNADTLMK